MFGVLPVNKPAGFTSRDVVNKVQRLVKPDKCGHTGTLDPMATGVLLVAVGSATRLVDFSHQLDKSYAAKFHLGRSSDTLDSEGVVTEQVNAPEVTRAQLEATLKQFTGVIEQVPPKYSAVHVDGKRAYQLARDGKEFELQSRQVSIHELELTDFDYPFFELNIACGTGTYVRTLGADIAICLGSNAVMTELVRTSIGRVHLEQCVSLDQMTSSSEVERALLPPHRLVDALPMVRLNAEQSAQIRNGIPICLSEDAVPSQKNTESENGPLAAIDTDESLVAVIQRERSTFRSLRVFQKTIVTSQPSKISTPHSPES